MRIMYHEIGRDKLYKIWNTINGSMIIYTYTDGGSIVFSDRILPIAKGALCYIGPDTPHYTMPDVPSVYDRSKIFVSSDVVNRLLSVLTETNGMQGLFLSNSVIYAQIPKENQSLVEDIFARAHKASQSKDGMEELMICSFFELMFYLKKYTVQQVSPPDDFLPKALEYINRNYSKNITLDDICESAYVSKYYFCRRFKNRMGMTVMEYLCQTRLSAAKAMLTGGDMRIEDIAERCGFSSVSYFSQMFKKRTGMSATKYRRTAGHS